jgi:hypothetical protein
MDSADAEFAAPGGRTSIEKPPGLSFTTLPMAFMDDRVIQSMVPQELQNRATYILVKLSPGARSNAWRSREPRPGADPPGRRADRQPRLPDRLADPGTDPSANRPDAIGQQNSPACAPEPSARSQPAG